MATRRPCTGGDPHSPLSGGLLPHPAVRRQSPAQSGRRGTGRQRSAVQYGFRLLAAHLCPSVGAVVGRRWVSVGHHSPSTPLPLRRPDGRPPLGPNHRRRARYGILWFRRQPQRRSRQISHRCRRPHLPWPLEIRVHNLVTGTIQDRFTFPPRR